MTASPAGERASGGTARNAIALDVGDARIGLAAGALGSSLAFGRGALERQGTKRDVPEVLRVAAEEDATVIVVGLPLRLDGTDSPQTKRVRTFTAELRAAAGEFGLTVLLEDERLSTRIATTQVARSGLPRNKRQQKGRLDEGAAVIILESYLRRTARVPLDLSLETSHDG